MNLLKTSILNGIAVLIKTATLFILNKILAVYVGPAGYAAIGQFQNFIQMITTFSGTVINNAIVKYTAENNDAEEKQIEIWRTASTLILIFSILFSFIILISKGILSKIIFHSNEFENVFVWFALLLTIFNLNSFILAILNGKKEIKKLVIVNIAGSIFSLIITSTLAIYYGIIGALISLSIYQSLTFIVTLTLCFRMSWFKKEYFFGKIDTVIVKKISSFALMALVSVFFGNIAQILLRNLITAEFGLNFAGYWDAMTRLSNGYLLFASTILGVYYLPRLSELKKIDEIRKEVLLGYKVILPIAIFSSIFIYIFQHEIVKILFTDKFLPMLELLAWQLMGDVTKIGSWIISYMMLSKAMTRLFIFTETIFALNILPLTYLFIHLFGYKGVAIAFFINCLLYWLVCSYSSNKELEKQVS